MAETHILGARLLAAYPVAVLCCAAVALAFRPEAQGLVLGPPNVRAHLTAPAQPNAVGNLRRHFSISSVTPDTPTANPENGKHVFETHGCTQCHGNQGQGLSNPRTQDAAPRVGPTRLSQTAFVGFVRHPIGKMPAYRSQDVSDAELGDLYAFLQSLAPPVKADPSSANAKNGQRLFMSYGCYECHGNEGQGSTQTAGSRIGPIQIPFAPFVAYIRQPNAQMPPYSANAVSDADLADIYAFLLSRPQAAPAKSIPLLNQ
jgi:mono/diheme cytochrome c family protein